MNCQHPNYDDYFDSCPDCGYKPTHLSVTEYASWKGISRQAVLSKIKRGIIQATRIGKYWIIAVPEHKKDSSNLD